MNKIIAKQNYQKTKKNNDSIDLWLKSDGTSLYKQKNNRFNESQLSIKSFK